MTAKKVATVLVLLKGRSQDCSQPKGDLNAAWTLWNPDAAPRQDKKITSHIQKAPSSMICLTNLALVI